MARPVKLTAETQKAIVAYIRAGAFDWVAAEAGGIGSSTFRRWMKEGEQGSEEFHGFYEAVREARAQARVAAEVEIRKDNPLAWLRYGPGRDRAQKGEPGWTDSKDVTVKGDEDAPVPVTLQFGKAKAKKPAEMTDEELEKAQEVLGDDSDGD